MIRIQNASKYYGSHAAVDQVSLEVGEGETVVLLGTSGSGKTTLLKLINRLEALSEGTVYVGGKNIKHEDPVALRRQMGYVIQSTGLFPHYTVAENVAVVPRLLGWAPARTAGRIHEVLAMLGLPPNNFLHKYPHQLSGGQQQRVGLARALAADPPVILMDEPFGALDPITRASIRHEFRSLEALQQKTIVLVTHDVQEAFELGDRICLMDRGQVQQFSTPKTLLAQPSNAFVTEFLQQHRFQLQLQVLQLKDILPFLPQQPLGNTLGQDFSPTTSVLEMLEYSTMNHTVSTTPAAAPPVLLAAAAKAIQQMGSAR